MEQEKMELENVGVVESTTQVQTTDKVEEQQKSFDYSEGEEKAIDLIKSFIRS